VQVFYAASSVDQDVTITRIQSALSNRRDHRTTTVGVQQAARNSHTHKAFLVFSLRQDTEKSIFHILSPRECHGFVASFAGKVGVMEFEALMNTLILPKKDKKTDRQRD